MADDGLSCRGADREELDDGVVLWAEEEGGEVVVRAFFGAAVWVCRGFGGLGGLRGLRVGGVLAAASGWRFFCGPQKIET
jgi:hypothetical protein